MIFLVKGKFLSLLLEMSIIAKGDRICTALCTNGHIVCPLSTLYIFQFTCLKETGGAHLRLLLPPSFSQFLPFSNEEKIQCCCLYKALSFIHSLQSIMPSQVSMTLVKELQATVAFGI